MTRQYDLAIIGSGPGGYAAALAARRKGLRVALIERAQLGGICLNVGCIPTKAMVAVAQTLRKIRDAAAYGIYADGVRVRFEDVLARNQRIVATLRQGLADLLRHHQVELLTGEAAFDDPHTLRLTHEGQAVALSAARVIIATGASPSPGPWGFDGKQRVSYRELLSLPALPTSLLVIGGGVIGCEFASCFASFGVPVTIVEPQPQVLPMEDPEAVRALSRSLQARGVTILTNTTVQTLTTSADAVQATFSTGQTCRAALCLIAIGQRPNSRGLGLEPLGIRTDDGVEVNRFLLTRHPHIAAIGDCLAGHGLAHLAGAEGVLAVRNLCESPPISLDHRLVPRCVFTDPELAQVGPLESEVAARVRVSRFSFAALGKALCDEEPEGFVKLLVDSATDTVRGATIVGADASSLIHLAVLAMHHGVSAKQLAHTITAHPTMPEALTEAAAQIYGEALYSTKGSRVKAP